MVSSGRLLTLILILFSILLCCVVDGVLSAFALGSPVQRVSHVNSTNTFFDTIQAAYDSASTVDSDVIVEVGAGVNFPRRLRILPCYLVFQ